MEKQKVTHFKPHPTQWKALNFETQFGAAICGSQSGKTTIGAVWSGLRLQEELQRPDPRPGLIGAPTYKVMRQSTLQKFFEQFPQLQQYHKRQESVIEVPYTDRKGNNKIYPIFVRSFDRPLGVEGMSPGWAWLDEFGQCDQLAWTVVKTRMTVTLGKIFITTTPYNTGFLYQDIYIPVQEGTEDRMSIFTWSAYELADFFEKLAQDETLKPEEKRDFLMKAKGVRDHLNNEKRALAPEEFKKRYMGEFSRMTGLVYNLRDEHIIPRQKVHWDKVVGGIDWGYHHPAVGVYGYSEGKWYVIDEWAGEKKVTQEIINACKELQEEYGVSVWYADSANPDKIKEARSGTGLNVVPFKKKKYAVKGIGGKNTGTTRGSIEYGVSYINALIRENNFRVFEDCKNHRHEFEAYHYPEDPRPGFEDIPVKQYDHFCFPAGTLVGGKKIEDIGTSTGVKDVYAFDIAGGITATPDHPVITNRGVVPMDSVWYTDVIWKKQLFMEASNGISIRTLKEGLTGVTFVALKRGIEAMKRDYIDSYTQNTLGRFLKDSLFITLMGTLSIMKLLTLSVFSGVNTSLAIWKIRKEKNRAKKTWQERVKKHLNGHIQKKDKKEGKKLEEITPITYDIKEIEHAIFAEQNILQKERMEGSAETTVVKKHFVGHIPVYALRTRSGTFRANGLLVSNCDAMRYAILGDAPATTSKRTKKPKSILDWDVKEVKSVKFQFV